MFASQNLTLATVLIRSFPSAHPSFSNNAWLATALVKYAKTPAPCSGKRDTFFSCGATDSLNRAERAGNEAIPLEAASAGMVDKARATSESAVVEEEEGEVASEEEEEEEEEGWASRCRVASSLANGNPLSTLCSSALTAVKILRAR